MFFRGMILWACIALACGSAAYGQSADSVGERLTRFPDRLFGRIQSKTAGIDRQLTRQTEKYLRKMARQEKRLQGKLSAVDSNGAKTLFAGSQERYKALLRRLQTDTSHRANASGQYRPYVDSLMVSMNFLNQNPQLLSTVTKSASPEMLGKIQGVTGQLQTLQSKMQDADEVDQFVQQRRAQISQYLTKYSSLPGGVTGAFDNYKKQAYYYKQQVEAYKDMLNDPDKLFKTALGLLDKLPAFTSFVRSHSALSGMLNLPGVPVNGGTAAPTTVGLPSRDQVLSVIQPQVPGGAPGAQALSQKSIESAQDQVDQMRNELSAHGGGDPSMPDFKPNTQKTRTFLQRLEIGTNLQTVHSTYYFPTTTDIGITIGYKLNDNNVVGVAASYKIGWGSDIHHIRLSSQGAGLRSFLDVRIKKTFFASGGFEYNYQQPFSSFKPLNYLSNWQKSGLIGVSKIVSMKTRVFKKTKLQLLWDFLSYQQKPPAPAFLFRIGYSF